ncbi:hypothetical protein OROGR_012944 [Orobanche gracilis]
MVRRRMEIKPIEDKAKRHTTFTKRRQGLMKKTQEFATKFEAQAAVIAFSKAGNVFAFGHPSVDSLVTRYLAEPSSELEEKEEEAGGVVGVEEVKEEWPVEKRISQALERGSWNVAVEGLGSREIDELSAEIVKIKRAVAARISEIAARLELMVEARATGLAAVPRRIIAREFPAGGSLDSGVGGIEGNS